MATVKIDDATLAQISGVKSLDRGPAIFIGVGVVAMVFVMVSMTLALNELTDRINTKRLETSALEARKTELLRSVRALEADRTRLSVLVRQLASDVGRLSPSLRSRTEQALAASELLSRQVANQLPTVIFVLSNDEQADISTSATTALASRGFHVSPPHKIRSHGIAPDTTEVRYFRHPDGKLEASEIAKTLQASGVPDARVMYIADPSTPSNQYEVWFSKTTLPAPTPASETSPPIAPSSSDTATTTSGA